VSTGPVTLSSADYDEVVARLLGVRRLAQELVEVFTESVGAAAEPTKGARAMLESIDRVLALLGADPASSK
jgi:hypothetical protein